MKKLKFKKVVAATVASILVLGSVACAPAEEKVEKKVEEQVEVTTEEKDSVTIVDQAGREIVIEQPVESIVSAYYITTYTTIALGLTDKIIGLEKKAESRPIYSLAAPELLTVDQIGSLKEFNVEAVAELNPDLVIVPMKLLDQANTLTDLGLNVLVVDPETNEGLQKMIHLIGAATGADERATELINAQNEILRKVADLVADKEFSSVYMGSNSSYLETATSQMYQNFLIETAGGLNIFSEIEGTYWTPVSYEAILEHNPEYIILPSAASYSVDDVLADPQLQDINAVKNMQVFQMPYNYEEWDSPVPSGVLGVYWLATILHGNDKLVEEFNQDVASFYKEFYDFEVITDVE